MCLMDQACIFTTTEEMNACTGYSSSRHGRQVSPFEPGPALLEHPFEGLPDDPFGELAAEQAMEVEGAAAEHGLPDDPFGDISQPPTPVAGMNPTPITDMQLSKSLTSLRGLSKD